MHTVEVVGLDELTKDMMTFVKKYPDFAGDILRSEALKTRKDIVKNARESMKTDRKRKRSLGRIGSYRVSQIQGIGKSQYVEISARSPHYHLLERGHAIVTPYGRTIKKKSGETTKIKFSKGGQTIGRVSGKYFLKKAKDAEAERFPQVMNEAVDILLKKSGLW